MPVQEDLLRDLPEWLEDFKENVKDEGMLASRDTPASTSHDSVSERSTKVVSRKHRIFVHFLKDRNCAVCKRTKIRRAPCRKRTGDAALRAENFGNLLTADHKVLNEGCESRINHQYAVEVQDLATQQIQSYPCKTKTSQETERSLRNFPEPSEKSKVIETDSSLEFGKSYEELWWNHCTSTLHRSETKGIAERAVRRIKEGISAVLLQSGLDEKWWADSVECYCYLRNVQDLLSGENTSRTAIWRTIQRTSNSVWLHGGMSSCFCQSRLRQFGQTVRSWRSWKRQKSMLGDSVQRRL